MMSIFGSPRWCGLGEIIGRPEYFCIFDPSNCQRRGWVEAQMEKTADE
jgi:hypothetical protein